MRIQKPISVVLSVLVVASIVVVLVLPASREALLGLYRSASVSIGSGSATALADSADEAGESREIRSESAEAGPAGSDSADRSGGSGEKGERRLAPLPVSAVIVDRAPFVLTVRATGRAEAVGRAELSVPVGDRITSVGVRPGDHVSSGAELLRLDARRFEIALAEARAVEGRAQLDFEAQLFSDENADASKRTRIAHKVGLTEAEQRVARAELDLDGTTLRAPFAGEVASVGAVVGERVRADETLVELVDLDPIRIPAEVLESDFGTLVRGSEASVQFPALPGELFEGTIRSLSPELDPDRGTGTAYIELANPEGRIKPGMYADVRIVANTFADRLAVPRSALLERNKRLLVFRAQQKRAEWSYVDVGLETDGFIEITSGVAPGDTVLVGGHLTLAHGAPIKVSFPK